MLTPETLAARVAVLRAALPDISEDLAEEIVAEIGDCPITDEDGYHILTSAPDLCIPLTLFSDEHV